MAVRIDQARQQREVFGNSQAGTDSGDLYPFKENHRIVDRSVTLAVDQVGSTDDELPWPGGVLCQSIGEEKKEIRTAWRKQPFILSVLRRRHRPEG